jgi:SAM-dependent methyltransferase
MDLSASKNSNNRHPARNGQDPLYGTAETVASYDRAAEGFAARWNELRLDRALNAFAGRVTGQRRVLDLGCGPGRDVHFLTQLGCQAVGLDLSAGMLAQARSRLPAVPLVRADLRRIPFSPGAFDGIWACASLLHLRRAELPAILTELSRLLRCPGGVLYVALKGGQGERWITAPSGERYFFAYYQSAEVETQLDAAGFQVVESWVTPDQAGRDEPWINAVARVRTG